MSKNAISQNKRISNTFGNQEILVDEKLEKCITSLKKLKEESDYSHPSIDVYRSYSYPTDEMSLSRRSSYSDFDPDFDGSFFLEDVRIAPLSNADIECLINQNIYAADLLADELCDLSLSSNYSFNNNSSNLESAECTVPTKRKTIGERIKAAMHSLIFYRSKKYNSLLVVMLAIFSCMFLFTTESFAIATSSTQGGDELKSVWDQVSRFFGGYGGKLAALGIIAASVLVRDRIGIPMMILGIIAGMMLPSLPAIIDNFTITLK